MKTSKIIAASSLLILATGCVTPRYALLSAPAVSMTKDSTAVGSKGSEIGPVTARYCTGDDATTKHGSEVGLMDEVIARAQKDKGASYIANAAFSMEGNCIVLEGTAMK